MPLMVVASKCHLRLKKKFAKNVSDSRTYFSSAQSSGSAEVRVNVAVM